MPFRANLVTSFGPLYRSNTFQNFFKKWCLAGSWRPFNSNFGGKGENHRNPPQKGGEKMETIPRNDFILRHRYDAFCKAVLRNEAKSYWSEMAHRREREKSLDALTQEEMDKLSVVDDYPQRQLRFFRRMGMTC